MQFIGLKANRSGVKAIELLLEKATEQAVL